MSVIRRTISGTTAVLIVIAVVVVLAIGAVIFSRWWQDRQASIRRHGYERQQAVRDEVSSLIVDYTGTPLTDTAHRGALKSRICLLSQQIKGDTDPTTAGFVAKEC